MASYRAMVKRSGVPLIHLLSTGAELSLCGLPLVTLGPLTLGRWARTTSQSALTVLSCCRNVGRKGPAFSPSRSTTARRVVAGCGGRAVTFRSRFSPGLPARILLTNNHLA